MAKAKKLEGWITNNFEKTQSYNLWVGNTKFTPDNYIKFSSLDKMTKNAVLEELENGILLHLKELPGNEILEEKPKYNTKYSKIVHLPNGSVVSEPYLNPDMFVNQTWKEIAKGCAEINDIDILEGYKERALSLLKPQRIIDIIDSRIKELLSNK